MGVDGRPLDLFLTLKRELCGPSLTLEVSSGGRWPHGRCKASLLPAPGQGAPDEGGRCCRV